MAEAVKQFKVHGFAQFPVRDGSQIVGVLTKSDTTKWLVKRRVTQTDCIKMIVSKELRRVSKKISLNELARILDRSSFALVDKAQFVTTTDLLKEVAK